MISVECPACRQGLNIPDEFAGQSGRCNYCGSIVVVPAASGASPSSALADLPFATPRRPARSGAGMLANEAEHEGGAGARLGRIILFTVLALILTACILPALVIGFSAETAPEGPQRVRSVPTARGTKGALITPPPATAPAPAAPPAEVKAPPEDEKRIVVVGPKGGAYHKTGCRLAGDGAQATTLGKARERGMVPCPTCGG